MSDTKNVESEKKLSPAEIVERTTIADVYRADKQLAGIVKKTRNLAAMKFSLSPKICSIPAHLNCAELITKSVI